MKHIDSVIDILGQELVVGDFVAYAGTWGRSPDLKIGKVREARKEVQDSPYGKRGILILRVRGVENTRPGQGEPKAKQRDGNLGYSSNVLRLKPEDIPEDIKEALRDY